MHSPRCVWPLATVVIVLLTACTPTPLPATPTPGRTGASATPSATADATPSPDATPAVVVFDGDCDALLPPDEADAVLGGARGVDSRVDAVLGSVHCDWSGDAGDLTIDAYPAGVVAEAIAAPFDTMVCEPSGGDGCQVGVAAASAWGLVTLRDPGGSAWQEPPAQLMAAAAAVAGPLAGAAGSRAVPNDRWWTADCADVAREVDIEAVIGPITAETMVAATVAEEIARAAGSLIGPCVWSGGDGVELTVIGHPGLDWDDYRAPLAGAAPVEVAGAAAAAQHSDTGGAVIAASDGTNVVEVRVVVPGDHAEPAAVA
ncbi:MAG: hypothetical protein ACK5KK_07720, partial [Microbacterium sp.]